MPKYPGACLALPSAAVNAAEASTELMLISLMLEVADWAHPAAMRNLPSMDGYEESISKIQQGQ